MRFMETSTASLWPFILYGILVLAVVSGMLTVSALLGQRHRERATDETYESGIVSTGTAGVRFDAKFYLMAMFFVIFDVEAVFVYAYAVSFRELGWTGYGEILVFIGILLAALVYLWRMGALDWAVRGQQSIKERLHSGPERG
jgi:NADH-quinone oxidoreductase subunit A